VYVIRGELDINHERVRAGDQARITQRELLSLRALESCEFILVDAPAWRR
jgi:hypothetical protein